MNEPTDNIPPSDERPSDQGQPLPPAYTERLPETSPNARLPEKVGQGVFATGAIVLEGPEEFVIDFVQALARPSRVAARVVVSPRVLAGLVAALRDNLQKYDAAFGPPKELPKPPTDRRPSIPEIYNELKLSDDMLSGAYATAAMIGHSPGEFVFDFITRFFPTPAVSSRVYMSASHVPRVLETLATSLQHSLNKKRPPESTRPPDQML